MHVRSILTGTLSLLLAGVLTTACDGDPSKPDAKAEPKPVEPKTVEPKTVDAKVAAHKPEPPQPETPQTSAADVAPADVTAANGGTAAAGTAGGDGVAAPAEDGDSKAGDAKADDSGKAGSKKGSSSKGSSSKGGSKKPKAEPAGPKVDAKGIYMKKCKTCHGVSGKADTKLGEKYEIADWTKPGWKGKWSQSKIENIVTTGKSGTKMKAFKSKLSADEITAVAKYSRSLGR